MGGLATFASARSEEVQHGFQLMLIRQYESVCERIVIVIRARSFLDHPHGFIQDEIIHRFQKVARNRLNAATLLIAHAEDPFTELRPSLDAVKEEFTSSSEGRSARLWFPSSDVTGWDGSARMA